MQISCPDRSINEIQEKTRVLGRLFHILVFMHKEENKNTYSRSVYQYYLGFFSAVNYFAIDCPKWTTVVQERVSVNHFIFTWCLGLPTMEGNTALGASSPANPALHMPDPLSITRAAISSSHIFFFFFFCLPWGSQTNGIACPFHCGQHETPLRMSPYSVILPYMAVSNKSGSFPVWRSRDSIFRP